MLSLRAAVAAAARIKAVPTSPIVICRPITVRGNGAQPSNNEKRNAPSAFIDNAPGWNEDLATASEAFVKADRETVAINEMQQKTVNYVQSRHHDPEVEQTHASYARDEVGGPLGNSGVGEFEGVVGDDDLGPDDVRVESDGRLVTRRVVHKKTTTYEGKSGAS